MKGNRQVRSAVARGLEETHRWRINQEESFERKERELEQRSIDLQKRLELLQQELETVRNSYDQAQQERSTLGVQEITRKRQLLFSGLQSENALLQERTAEYNRIEDTQNNNLQNMLSIPEIAKKVDEYEAFLEKEEALSQLPESYRKAILAHHDIVRQDLDPIFDAMNSPLPRSELSLTAITLPIFTESVPGDKVKDFVMILPVRFERYTHWTDGGNSLEDLLLFRVNGLIASALKKLGMPKTVIMEEDFEGYVLLDISIVSELSGDLKLALQEEVRRMNKQASELQVAQLLVEPVFLGSDLIEYDEEEE